MIVDGYMDVFDAMYANLFGGKPKEAFFEKIDWFFKIIEPFACKGQWLAGPKISIADFWVGALVFSHFKNPKSCYGTEPWGPICEKYPGVKAWMDRFCKENMKRMDCRVERPM